MGLSVRDFFYGRRVDSQLSSGSFDLDEHDRLSWHHLDCKCSYHAHAEINHTTTVNTDCARDRILTTAESDRHCLAMGCQQIVTELNSRLGTNFSLQNTYVTFSLHFCMQQNLDFGTAFAYFMAAGVKVCTSSLSCSFKRDLQDDRWSYRTAIELPNHFFHCDVCYKDIRPYHVFGTHPNFKAYVSTTMVHRPIPWNGPCGDINLGYISNPYESLPRRLWDVYSNRVIPTELLTLKSCENGCTSKLEGLKLTTTFWAISHSWTEEMVAASPSVTLTRINSKEWRVPIPHGISLHDLRTEILRLISLKENAQPRTTLYCWLDILCLRQKNKGQEQLRRSEWETDIPTIGQIYRISEGVIRYFNGLGKPFSLLNWDSDRHWWNRAWTLQEIRDEAETLTGGIYSTDGRALTFPMNFDANVQGVFQGQAKRLADIIAPLQKLAKDCSSTTEAGGCSVLELIQEMRRRNATSDVDKIAGLSFLLLSETLPRYSTAKTPEQAWVACLMSLRYIIKLELLYNFPLVRFSSPDELDLFDLLWTPTWSQIIRQPAPISFYDRPACSIEAHTVSNIDTGNAAAVYKPSTSSLPTLTISQGLPSVEIRRPRAEETPQFSILEVLDAFVVEDCEILEGAYLCNKMEEYIRYIVQLNPQSQQSQLEASHQRFVVEFCSPRYRVDDGIGTQNCHNTHILPPLLQPGKYILVTHSLSPSSGWVIGRRRDVHPKEKALAAITWKDENCKAKSTEEGKSDGDGDGGCNYFIEKAGVVNTEDVGRLKDSGCLLSGVKCYFV
ncbi:hypothetical protein EV426DRAFT_587848 [Tirmania nivea]|nr:hypothetical protein EV426DRAFT_587848 [Tirmania nivea]